MLTHDFFMVEYVQSSVSFTFNDFAETPHDLKIMQVFARTRKGNKKGSFTIFFFFLS